MSGLFEYARFEIASDLSYPSTRKPKEIGLPIGLVTLRGEIVTVRCLAVNELMAISEAY